MFICLYSLSLSLSLRLFIVIDLGSSFQIFSLPSPIPSRFISSRESRPLGGKGNFFLEGARIAYALPRSLPFPEQSVETSDVDKISGFRSAFITYIPPPLFHPLSFLVEIFFHPPLPRYSADLSSYKDVYRREAIGFFPTTVYRLEHEEEASGILYSRAHVRARIQGVPFSTFSKMVARRRRMIFKSVGISIRKLMIIKEE